MEKEKTKDIPYYVERVHESERTFKDLSDRRFDIEINNLKEYRTEEEQMMLDGYSAKIIRLSGVIERTMTKIGELTVRPL